MCGVKEKENLCVCVRTFTFVNAGRKVQSLRRKITKRYQYLLLGKERGFLPVFPLYIFILITPLMDVTFCFEAACGPEFPALPPVL